MGNQHCNSSASRFPCASTYQEALNRSGCNNVSNVEQCPYFCDDFHDYIPYIYGSLSIVSGVCCCGVFLTYFCFSRFKQTGTSSSVFLYRTLMDLVIAIGHIIAGFAGLAAKDNNCYQGDLCKVLGVINEFALMASNLWYVVIAVDLVRAIRNPFSPKPQYRWIYHTLVWSFSILCAVVLASLHAAEGPGGPGTSMFFWCWIDVEQVKLGNANTTHNDLIRFAVISLALFYLPYTIIVLISMLTVIVGSWILYNHLVSSNETRRFVIKQNMIYVSVLAIETLFILPIWIAQLNLQRKNERHELQFWTKTDLGIAALFAVVHSLRGTVDLIVWLWNFTQPRDIKLWCKTHCLKFSKKRYDIPITSTASSVHLSTPLIITNKKDSLVNKALRRDAIYCINVGILESVQVHHDMSVRDRRVGSVRESFAAAALMELDQENQRDELSLRYDNPNYREQVTRKLRFPASSGKSKYFTFIDLEPTLFRLLRESYGISPNSYRKSFAIGNFADIDGSPMLEKFTEGKSGSFLYFTQDLRFIIKTVSPSEEKFLRRVAISYYRHMQENEDSLIARFFGLHKIRMAPEQKYITVVVMENVVYSSNGLKMHRRYDLKGSWVGRRSLKGNVSLDGYKGVLKDLDLGEEKILIGPELKEQLMDQMKKDVKFLTSCHIMDYSLLLGIHQHGLTGEVGQSISEVDVGSITEVNIGSPKGTNGNKLFEDKPRTYSRHNTVTSTFGYGGMADYDLHIPWFRQDCGGLRSNSPLHPYSGRPISIALENNRYSIVSVGTPPVTYFFGIIDILQQYTVRKHLEHIFKTKIQRQDLHGLSCVNENEYGERFLNFMDSIIQ